MDADGCEAHVGGTCTVNLDKLVRALNARGFDLEVSLPRICYRETIQKKSRIDYTHKKLFGGSGQFARVIFDIEPNQRDAGYQFANNALETSIPSFYLTGINKGLNSVLDAGILIGAPVVDIRITLVDGAFHDIDSSPLAFEIASRAALRGGLESADAVLLQPMMNVEISTPGRFSGVVIGDLNERYGVITDVAEQDDHFILTVVVPLANMLDYAHTLSLLTHGQGRFAMAYSHYAVVAGSGDNPENSPPAMAMRA